MLPAQICGVSCEPDAMQQPVGVQEHQEDAQRQQRQPQTVGQQLLVAAVERLGGFQTLHAEAAAGPNWQPAAPAAAAAQALSERRRRLLSEFLSNGSGLPEQPVRVSDE